MSDFTDVESFICKWHDNFGYAHEHYLSKVKEKLSASDMRNVLHEIIPKFPILQQYLDHIIEK